MLWIRFASLTNIDSILAARSSLKVAWFELLTPTPLAVLSATRCDSLVHAKGGRARDNCLWSAHADDYVENVVRAGATADVFGRDSHEARERNPQLGLRRVWVDVVINLGVSRGRSREKIRGRHCDEKVWSRVDMKKPCYATFVIASRTSLGAP